MAYTKSLYCRLSILQLSLQVQFSSPLIIPVLFLQALSPPGPHLIYLNWGVPKTAPDDEQSKLTSCITRPCAAPCTPQQPDADAPQAGYSPPQPLGPGVLCCNPASRAATLHVLSWLFLSIFRSLFVPLLNYILICPLCHHQFQFWSGPLTSLQPISALCHLQI